MTNWTNRLLEAIDRLTSHGDSPNGPGHRLILTVDVDELERLAAEARAALAQPEPDGPSVEQMYYWALKAIRRYGLDTLSGRADGGAGNREWQRAAVVEMVRRAQTALDYGGPGSRPAIEPVPTPEPGTADHITDDEGTRWDRTMDAALWAKAFCLICPEMASREDVMIGWFANAIMAGCDHQAWKMDAERKPVPVGERPWEREGWCDTEGNLWAEHISRGGTASWRYVSRDFLGGWCERCLPHWALPVPTSHENP